MSLEYKEDKINSTANLLTLTGELTLYNCRELQKLIEKVKDERKNLVILLSPARSIDSSSLGVLMKAQKDFIQVKREIILVNNNKFIQSIFDVTRFGAFFKIFETLEEAQRNV